MRNPISQVIGKARRRMLAQGVLQQLGWLLPVAVGVDVLLLTGARVYGVEWEKWVYLGPVAAVAAAAGIYLLRRKLRDETVAAAVDERLGLKDRLATALYARKLAGDAFTQQVEAEATAAAQGARLGEAFPVRMGRAWGYLPMMLGVFLGAWLFLPLDMLGWAEARQNQQAVKEQDKTEAEAAKEELAKVVENVRKLEDPQKPGEMDEALAKELQELAELTRQDLRTPQSKKEAAAKLSQLQEKLAEAAEQKEQQVQTMQSAMSRMEAGESGPADRFAEAMRRGDFEAAQKELEELAAQVDQMDEKDKQAMAEQLKNLAKQLDEMAREQGEQQAAARQEMEKQLQEAGLTQEQAAEMARQAEQGASQEQMQQQMQKQGMNPQQAQQMAQKLAEQQQKQSACSQCQGTQQQMSQAMQQMSQGMQQQMSQQGTQGAKQEGGKPASSQQFKQGQGQMSKQLQQMAKMQQQANQMKQAQKGARQAMQNSGCKKGGSCNNSGPNGSCSKCGGQGYKQPDKKGGKQPGGNGTGGGIGTEAGGNPMGNERQLVGYDTETQSENNQGQGKVIASWMSKGENAAGPATVEYDLAVKEAKENAEKAVTEDRVPKRYHQTIKDYFNQLPQTPEEARKGAPKAPR